MLIHCLINQHTPSPVQHTNQGFTFTHCTTCDRDLLRTTTNWIPVPRQMRVVWRNAASGHISAVPLPEGVSEGGMTIEPSDREGDSRPIESAHAKRPNASDFLDLALLGLGMIIWILGDRLKSVRLNSPAPMLLLPAPR